MIDIEKISQTLEAVANKYPEASEEYRDLRQAAIALHFVWQEEVRARFLSFIDNFDRELTEEEQSHLRSLGIL